MAARVETLGESPVGRQLYLASVRAFSDWPAELSGFEAPFFVVTALDATRAADDELGRFVATLVAQGARYLCAWGPECVRVHDAFDVAADKAGVSLLVTTDWFPDESLDEALWYAAWAAFNEDFPEMESVLVAVVEDAHSWAERVRDWAANGMEGGGD